MKKLSKKLHFFKEFETMSNNNHKLWKTINNLLPSKLSNSSGPNVIKVGDVKVDNPTNIANHFNKFFCKIGQSLADKVNRAGNENPIKYLNNRINESIFLTPTNFQEISRIISSLKNSSSFGPDGISSFFLKIASDVVSFPLSIFFNLFIEQGCFPESLKLSKVIPMFKSGAKCDLSNYRPISLLSVISKMFEKLISIRVMSFIEKHSILSPTQYGFRPESSTEFAILDIVSSCYENINEKLFTGLIMIDLKKAFDSVTHSILLQKLEHYGFRGNVFNLFSSYLSNRQQYVSVNNVNSSTQYIKYGVPQGSVLGPLLFLLYINDLENSCNSTPRLFADDTCVIAKGTSPAQLELQLNHELNQIAAWINANNLTINPSKTYALIISPFTNLNSPTLNLFYNHHRIDVVRTVKYLGIILDNQLLFKQHIKMLESKLSRYVGIIFKLKSFLPKYILSKIYYAFIHSYLNYGLIIWGATPASNLSKLCRIQNKALRVITGTGWREHAPPLYATQKILQLSKLITYSVAKFMHKFTNKKLPATFNHFFTAVAKIHSRYTRNSTKPNQYFIPFFHTSRSQRTIKFRGAKTWNAVPNDLKRVNFYHFKLKFKQYLLNNN